VKNARANRFFSAQSGFRARKRDFARAEPGQVRANRKIAAQSEFCPRKTDFIRAKMPAPRAAWIFAAQSGKASWLAAERQRSDHSGHKRNVHRPVGGEFFQVPPSTWKHRSVRAVAAAGYSLPPVVGLLTEA